MKTEPPKYRITDKTALDGKRWFVVQRYDYVHEKWAMVCYFKLKREAKSYLENLINAEKARAV